jgi:alkanesulfonate monooxygenase SsuD/methylene tetrahydromethanopterin reductase-like flavin-dependent oxidoreductase (luciferase family)
MTPGPAPNHRSAFAASWDDARVDLGMHLPLLCFGGEPLGRERLLRAVAAARDHGFAAVTANDHLTFRAPWLDGPTALAAAIAESGTLELATTVALPVVRGPVALAKALAALDVLSDGRVIAGVGPGSSERDYELAGIPFAERWPRFDEAVAVLRTLLRGEPPPAASRFYPLPAGLELAPAPLRPGGIPVWIGSWGSRAGLARVARAADGWLASAYNTTPERFATARAALPAGLPNALATMWTWLTDDRADAERVLGDVLAPLLRRDPGMLGEQVCVGRPEHCAELLARYAAAGCERVYLWPLGDEPRQLERVAERVMPALQ